MEGGTEDGRSEMASGPVAMRDFFLLTSFLKAASAVSVVSERVLGPV